MTEPNPATATIPGNTSVATAKTGDDFEPDPPAATATDPGKPDDADTALGDAGKQAIDRMKAEKTEAVKQLKAVQKELDAFRKASMTDSERLQAEAEQRGRQAAATEYGARLARASFDALAAQRNPTVDTSSILEFVDMAKFIGEDGEPDRKALTAAVQRLVPEPQNGPPSFDGGARSTASAPADMNAIIRRQAGRG